MSPRHVASMLHRLQGTLRNCLVCNESYCDIGNIKKARPIEPSFDCSGAG
jgi:hypothetical protein